MYDFVRIHVRIEACRKIINGLFKTNWKAFEFWDIALWPGIILLQTSLNSHTVVMKPLRKHFPQTRKLCNACIINISSSRPKTKSLEFLLFRPTHRRKLVSMRFWGSQIGNYFMRFQSKTKHRRRKTKFLLIKDWKMKPTVIFGEIFSAESEMIETKRWTFSVSCFVIHVCQRSEIPKTWRELWRNEKSKWKKVLWNLCASWIELQSFLSMYRSRFGGIELQQRSRFLPSHQRMRRQNGWKLHHVESVEKFGQLNFLWRVICIMTKSFNKQTDKNNWG